MYAAPGGFPGGQPGGQRPQQLQKGSQPRCVDNGKPASHAKAAPAPRGGTPKMESRHGRHPAGARHWARPQPPPRRHGGLRAWEWVVAAWNLTIEGVYYYGDGYYYDGYNYYYNGAYYTSPPVVVAQPAVVAPAPVVVTPAPQPALPHPSRRKGLLNVLFGD